MLREGAVSTEVKWLNRPTVEATARPLRSMSNARRYTGRPISQAGPTDADPASMDKPNLCQPQAPQQMPTEHPSYTSGIIRQVAAHPLGKISADGKGPTLTGEPPLPGFRDLNHSPHTRCRLAEEQGVGTDWPFYQNRLHSLLNYLIRII